jgi:hypothetical protein
MPREMGARGSPKASAAAGSGGPPPLPRVQLDSLERVRREMARLYVEGKHGRRDVQDVSRLANVLALIGRMIEGADLERRVEALEQAQARPGRVTG